MKGIVKQKKFIFSLICVVFAVAAGVFCFIMNPRVKVVTQLEKSMNKGDVSAFVDCFSEEYQAEAEEMFALLDIADMVDQLDGLGLGSANNFGVTVKVLQGEKIKTSETTSLMDVVMLEYINGVCESVDYLQMPILVEDGKEYLESMGE